MLHPKLGKSATSLNYSDNNCDALLILKKVTLRNAGPGAMPERSPEMAQSLLVFVRKYPLTHQGENRWSFVYLSYK